MVQRAGLLPHVWSADHRRRVAGWLAGAVLAWAAAAASFPLLIEAGRPLVSSPTNFQDLGAILFSAVALHQHHAH